MLDRLGVYPARRPSTRTHPWKDGTDLDSCNQPGIRGGRQWKISEGRGLRLNHVRDRFVRESQAAYTVCELTALERLCVVGW